MSLLPGVPDMGPAPVSPVPQGMAPGGHGKPGGIAALAHSVGKPARVQHLGSLAGKAGNGSTQVGGGDPVAHAMGHYGKTPPAGLAALLGAAAAPPSTPLSEHAGTKMIKGSGGGVKAHVKRGGLGPGALSTAGPSNTNYSMNSSDTE